MSEPRRLLQDEGDDFGLALLRSAREDAPGPHARHKTLSALGLAAGAAVTSTTATAAAATAASAAKATAATGLLTWIGVGVLGGLLTVGTVAVVQPTRAPAVATPAPINLEPPAMGDAPERVEAKRPLEAPPPPAATEAPRAATPETPRTEVGARPPAEPSAKPTLADEVAALDVARSALASGDAPAALRALDDHDRRFPGGVLGPEATVIRIEALASRGDRTTAVRLARAFLAAHPRSPHAARLRSLLGLDEP